MSQKRLRRLQMFSLGKSQLLLALCRLLATMEKVSYLNEPNYEHICIESVRAERRAIVGT